MKPVRIADWALRIALVSVLGGACGEGAQPSVVMNPLDSADQMLLKMSHYVTVEGVRRAHVLADTAFFFQPTQTIELRRVHIDFFDTEGRPTSTLTSREGTYWWRTGRMQGRGNVIVVTNDRGTLRTEELNYDQNKNEVRTDKHFVFDAPDRHVEAEGLVSDPSFRDVTATRPHGKGGVFVLPNQ